jgi:spore coat polysaccharide biosynthesis protein SpsF (cytidylyltransferase family)
MIKKLVSNENPRKPLSDNAIAEMLKNEGIEVAREQSQNIVNRYIFLHLLKEKS